MPALEEEEAGPNFPDAPSHREEAADERTRHSKGTTPRTLNEMRSKAARAAIAAEGKITDLRESVGENIQEAGGRAARLKSNVGQKLQDVRENAQAFGQKVSDRFRKAEGMTPSPDSIKTRHLPPGIHSLFDDPPPEPEFLTPEQRDAKDLGYPQDTPYDQQVVGEGKPEVTNQSLRSEQSMRPNARNTSPPEGELISDSLDPTLFTSADGRRFREMVGSE